MKEDDVKKFEKEFPNEWGSIQRRDKNVRNRPYGGRSIAGVCGRFPLPKNIKSFRLFLLLVNIDELLIHEQQRPECCGSDMRKNLLDLKVLYENEISSLVVEWSDEAFLFISKALRDFCNQEDQDKIFNQFKRLRKPTLKSWF